MKRLVEPAPSFEGLQPASVSSSHTKQMNRSYDARHERILRSLLWRHRFRFRKNDKSVEGKPDIVFRRERVAVFCDGDFWHGRHWRRLSQKLSSGTNSEYWIKKILTNKLRDLRTTRSLLRAGWQVIRVWETDILRDPHKVASMIEAILLKRRRGGDV
jgi:DNA mismatch endonuclease, patch repair protein